MFPQKSQLLSLGKLLEYGKLSWKPDLDYFMRNYLRDLRELGLILSSTWLLTQVPSLTSKKRCHAGIHVIPRTRDHVWSGKSKLRCSHLNSQDYTDWPQGTWDSDSDSGPIFNIEVFNTCQMPFWPYYYYYYYCFEHFTKMCSAKFPPFTVKVSPKIACHAIQWLQFANRNIVGFQ